MIGFILGFGVGIAAMLGVLIAEEYLRDASLRDEGATLPTKWADNPPGEYLMWN